MCTRMPVHVIIVGSDGSAAPMEQVRCVVNAWKKRKHVQSVMTLPHTGALVTQLVEVLPTMVGPVMVCNAQTTAITDARFDTWVARWVAATRPVWCTGSRTSPSWGVLCALNTTLRDLLQLHAAANLFDTLSAMHAAGKVECDSTPLAYVYRIPFWPLQPPPCVAPTRQLQSLMTSLMRRPSPTQLIAWDKVLIAIGVFLSICFLVITLKGISA